jgi:hypothetical protein
MSIASMRVSGQPFVNPHLSLIAVVVVEVLDLGAREWATKRRHPVFPITLRGCERIDAICWSTRFSVLLSGRKPALTG